MAHQDLKHIVWNKKTISNLDKKQYQKPAGNASFIQLDGDEPVAPKTISHDIKIRLQQARVSKKLSQKQLAKQINIPVNTIALYESGKGIPDKQILSKIGNILGVNFNKPTK